MVYDDFSRYNKTDIGELTMVEEKNKLYGGKKNTRVEERLSKSGSYRSRFYENYFEDHIVKTKPGKHNKLRFVRSYAGDYYVLKMSRIKQAGIRMLYAALFFLSVFLFILATSADVESNQNWFVVIAEMFNLLSLFWVLLTLVFYLTAKCNLTVGEYKSTSKTLIRSSLITMVSFVATAICKVIFLVFSPSERPLEILQTAMMLSVCGICFFIIYAIEKSLKYERRIN